MAKASNDRTTIDLFANEKNRGRPKTNPLSRKDQLLVNKRNQVKRDKAKGLKRVELKVETELFNKLNELAAVNNMSRSQVIESILVTQINALSHTNDTLSPETIELDKA
ncbi:LexA regulated protein [Psychrobium sp. 1_MG-2023]|uniref:LexA regulated protein n=1 Tax=Psychrobium sp. 1_MG-2023 TaxID=3062624 RepID=UPI000C31D813|nr:LexA regulated protein [Psychrobium sp. 1_MG-2023]MDP2562481.1 LexA regulated protein [Psychrobium sp. 1_MG-2023]PKF54315.1 LexA regulated protein [Alteromonadales bacterium alter-6D02]